MDWTIDCQTTRVYDGIVPQFVCGLALLMLIRLPENYDSSASKPEGVGCQFTETCRKLFKENTVHGGS